MEVDVLNYAIGGMLSMEYEDGNKDQQYTLQNLLMRQRNYKIHDKEILAVIRGLENWRHLLEGTKFKFVIQIDHKNLRYFIKVQKLNKRQTHWILYLLRFNFILKRITKIKY